MNYHIGYGSSLANPYSISKFGPDRSLRLYAYWLCSKIYDKDKEVTEALNYIYKNRKDIDLTCDCNPSVCHSNFIKNLINFKEKYRGNYYAGVGSRKTPQETCDQMALIAQLLYFLGYTLRSGGADGADISFEYGHDTVVNLDEKRSDKKQIFYAKDANKKCLEIAAKVHPNWDACSDYAKKLHGRNAMQILGKNLKTPVDFVICWTEGGKEVGGTRTAIKIAQENNIPVYNLHDDKFLV